MQTIHLDANMVPPALRGSYSGKIRDDGLHSDAATSAADPKRTSVAW